MKQLISILFIAFAITGCTSSSEAKRVLLDAGYSDIQTGGYGFFSCGRDDTFATKFTAKNPKGRTVSGVVCSGLFLKGATIRH